VVAKYVSLATAGGLQDWESIAALGEAELERRLFGASPEQRRVVEPDFGRMHLELRRKGVTLTLLWEEYRAANEGRRTWGLTQFCEHYKAYTKTLRRSMRQQHRAGEKILKAFQGLCGHQGLVAGHTTCFLSNWFWGAPAGCKRAHRAPRRGLKVYQRAGKVFKGVWGAWK
jgi:hypothetical protein